MIKSEQKYTAKLIGHDNAQRGKMTANIRNRIFLGSILLSMMLLFVVMAFNLQSTYQTARNDVVELSKSSSIQNAEDIELFFLRHEDVLLTTAEVLSYSLTKENIGSKEVEDLLHNISVAYNNAIYSKYANKEFTGIYAAVNGVLVHGLKKPDDLPEGYDPLKRQWYREAVDGNGKVVFGEPYQDIYSPNLVMTATKLLEDGKTVIAMDITMDDLQFAGGNMDVTVTLNGREHIYGYGFVLTNQGVVMAHRDKAEQGTSYDDPENPMYEVFQQIKQYTRNGTDYFETNIDGVNYSIFPHKLSNGWYVVTLTDLGDIRDSLSDFSVIILVGTVIVALLALLYCFLITRTHIKSQKLTEELTNALMLATKDGLTGHSNRAAYDMRIRECQEKLNTEKDESFAPIMMDLNDLKYINDHYGHAAGDQYIRNSCRMVRNIFTSEVYRIGGDEFAMFLTGEPFEQREALCERLKQEVAEANQTIVPNVDKPSIAIGMSVHIAGKDDDMNELLQKADTAMYVNKAEIKQARLRCSEKK